MPSVRARGIGKVFPGVIANEGVDLDLFAGEVHTLLGENGAGKSTLAAILSGHYRPDAGRLYFDGTEVVLASPRDGLAHGVGMVHQHFHLVDRFTVAEDIVLGDHSLPRVLPAGRVEEAVASVADEFGFPIDPRARVGDLSVGERQRVEIVKVLYRGAEVLLLDEPTAMLTPQETDALFENVRRLTGLGKAVVFISHKLGEVMEISDVVTVMRAGRVTGAVRTADSDREELTRMMVGRNVDLSARRSTSEPGGPLLMLTSVQLSASDGRELLTDIDLTVCAGEIVGVAGVAGNGQRELAEVAVGLAAPDRGRVEVNGVDVTGQGTRAARRAGVAYIPEDRLGVGLVPSLSIAENLLLTRPRGMWVDREAAAGEAARIIDRFEVKAPGPEAPTRVLSGGNAQKVLVARELAGPGEAPKVLVTATPTRGLDVGAIESVRAILDRFRSEGAAVLLISEDLEEVLSLADRIVVLYRGRLVHEVPGGVADRQSLGLAMAGVSGGGGDDGDTVG